MRILAIISGIGLLIMGACIDIIELETENKADGIIIVDANLELSSRSATVQIRQAAAFSAGPDGVELPVGGARVRLEEIGGTELTLIETETGIYKTDDAIGEAGKSYQLFIEVNGESYESKIEVMPERVPFDFIDHVQRLESFNNSQGNIETQEVVAIRSTTDLPNNGEGIFLRYRASGVYQFNERVSINDKICYVPERIDNNQLTIINGSSLNNGALNQQEFLLKRVDSRLAKRYCFTLVQISITENEYNFWTAIEDEFDRTGDIFETPPAKINGNILNTVNTKNDIIGLFSVTVADSAKYVITGSDVGFSRGPCEGFPPPAQGSPCYNCLLIQNSSYQEPDCF
ncbi:MAG: DUF4249 family protein [Bacteroidia bacterium]|nr:DUF4249 family protein [Bacteroidia bacterium]